PNHKSPHHQSHPLSALLASSPGRGFHTFGKRLRAQSAMALLRELYEAALRQGRAVERQMPLPGSIRHDGKVLDHQIDHEPRREIAGSNAWPKVRQLPR